jgi:hypothetical protein
LYLLAQCSKPAQSKSPIMSCDHCSAHLPRKRRISFKPLAEYGDPD